MSSHELLQSFPEFTQPVELLQQSVGVIGVGKVGLSIAFSLHRQQRLAWLVVRSDERRQQLQLAFESTPIFASVEELFEHHAVLPDAVVIATPDASIATVSNSLAQCFAEILNDILVVHCSGARGLDELQACRAEGARTAAAHPFQTFTHAHERLLHAICWGIECDADDEAHARSLVRLLGGTQIILDEFTREHKALYHMTAVFASNYVEAVLAAADDMAHAAHIQSALFLKPIVLSAVESSLMSFVHSGRHALSGPISRGDLPTIRRHCEELLSQPHLLRSYVYGALLTNERALRDEYINPLQFQQMQEYLLEQLRAAI